MGSINSNESKCKQQEFISNYDIIQEIQSERIRFLEHKQTKKQYLLRQLTYDNQKMYEQALENIKNKKQQLKNADHITAITQYFSKKVDTYCSDFYKIYVLFEYPQRTLDDQINERNLRKNNFSQTEIWSILASCILGLGHLQKKGIRHSSLKSTMIFLSQEGFIKISDPFTTGCQTNYETLLNKRGSKHIYLSPEQCQSLQNQIITPVINTYKSDIFTLGMIILECGLLQYQDQCYRDECSRIHWETLEYNKNRFRKTYSEQLANMLQYMLGAETNSRPQWIELQNYVITDNGSKSFISDGRKSVLAVYSKPVSVNINKLINDANQQKMSNAQRISANNNNNNISSTTINKGLRISSSKPLSVNKFQPLPVIQSKRSAVLTQFKPSNVQQINSHFTHLTHQKPIPLVSNFTTNNQRNQAVTFMSPTQNKPSTQSPLKLSQIQVHNPMSPAKRFDIKAMNPSNISMTRPFKSIFPNPFYETVTKADENLIQLDEEEQTSRTVSVSDNQSYQDSSQQQKITYNGHTNEISRHKFPTYPNNTQSFNVAPFAGNSVETNLLHQNPSQRQRFFKKAHNYQGEFVVETFKLGSRYEGYKLNGMRHGPGKFFYQDGGMYDGNWVRNKMEGVGRLYYQLGKLAYEGEWVEDQFKGHGTLFNQNPDVLNGPFSYENFDDVEQLWTKYKGQFDDDSKNGKGILYLSNGEYFQGSFVNDTAEGEGVFYALNGRRIHGIWDNNRLIRQI